MMRSILLLSATFLAQDAKPKEDSALDLFKRVERKYLDAATLKIKCRIKAVVDADERPGSVEAEFPGGNRFTIRGTYKKDDTERSLSLACDGKSIVRRKAEDAGEETEEAPPHSAENLRCYMLRMGVAYPADVCRSAGDLGDPFWLPAAEGFKSLDPEKWGDRDVRVIEFSLTARNKSKWTTRVWIDPKTLEILQRSLEFTGEKLEIREIYTGTVFGEGSSLSK